MDKAAAEYGHMICAGADALLALTNGRQMWVGPGDGFRSVTHRHVPGIPES